MYTFLIVLILIASVLMVLAVLVQSPKSGMASNFGASNQVMGVRQTADFLEKFTWGAAVTILALSLLSVAMMDKKTASVDVPNVDTPAVETPVIPAAPTADDVQTETAADVLPVVPEANN